jgi:hypothetical protein
MPRQALPLGIDEASTSRCLVTTTRGIGVDNNISTARPPLEKIFFKPASLAMLYFAAEKGICHNSKKKFLATWRGPFDNQASTRKITLTN